MGLNFIYSRCTINASRHLHFQLQISHLSTKASHNLFKAEISLNLPLLITHFFFPKQIPKTLMEEIWRRIQESDARIKELKYQIFLERNPYLKEIDEGVGRKYFGILFKAEPFIIKAYERLSDYYGEELQGHHTWDDYNLLRSHGRFDGVPAKVAMDYWKEHFPGVDFKEMLGISTTKSTIYRRNLQAGDFD